MLKISKINICLKKIVVTSILFLNGYFVFNQNNCTTRIKDNSLKIAIFPGNVIFSDSNNKTLRFEYLNEDGSFEIPKFDSLQILNKIIIKSSGYYSLEIKIENNGLPCNKTFYLVSNNSEDIKVISQNSFIIKPDTTKFIASSYKLGSEQNVENLLEKLPLVSVDANGNIYFKGKAINMLTIEGDDLLGNRYQDYTKNVSANGIQSFEFIENYIDSIDRVNGINNKQTLLNIIYKKTKRLFANINGASNNNANNSQLNTDIIKLGIKTKAISFLNANNIGLAGSVAINNSDNLFVLNSTHFLTPYKFDPNSQFDLVSNFNIPQEKLQLNNSLIGSFNIFKKLKSKGIFRQNLQLQLDKFDQQYAELTNYELGNNNLPNFEMQTNRLLKSASIVSNTKIDKTLSNKWKVAKNLKLVYLTANNINNTLFQNTKLKQAINKINTDIKFTQQFVNVTNNPKVKGHYFEASLNTNDGIYNIDSANYFSTLFNSYLNSAQQAASKSLQFNYEFQYSPTIFKKKLNSYITANYLNNSFNLVFGDKINKQVYNNNTSLIQTNKLKTFFVTSNNSTSFNIDKRTFIKLSLNTLFGYKISSDSKLIASILPSFNLNGIALNRFNFTFGFERLANLPMLSQVRPLNIITGINSLYYGNAIYNLSISNRLAVNIYWNKMANERKYKTNMFMFNLNFNKNPYLSKYSNFNQLIYIIDSSFLNNNNNFYAYYNKNILIKKSSISLNINLSGAKNNFINSSGLSSNYNTSITNELGWKYSLPKKLFIELNAKYTNSFSGISYKINDLNKIFISYTFKQKIEKKFGSKLNIQLANEFYYFKGFNNTQQQLNFLDTKVTYVINKKGASIALQGRNITNVNTLIEQFNTGISNQTNTYFLFPRLFLLRANFPL